MEELEFLQENKGLNPGMLKEVEVQELVSEVSSDREIVDVHKWFMIMYRKDLATFGTKIVSMDVEDGRRVED